MGGRAVVESRILARLAAELVDKTRQALIKEELEPGTQPAPWFQRRLDDLESCDHYLAFISHPGIRRCQGCGDPKSGPSPLCESCDAEVKAGLGLENEAADVG
jgi:hypothetical protein